MKISAVQEDQVSGKAIMVGGWIYWVLVALGGAMGSLARVGVTRFFDERGSIWGVGVVNVLGSFLFVVVLALLARLTHFSYPLKALLLSGFLGAFTTFSTFTYQTWLLWHEGAWFNMFCFLAMNMLGAIGAFFIGAWLLQYGSMG